MKEATMPDIFDISGRTVLITGSSRGIGFALAEGFAAAGCRLIVHGKNRSGVEAAATRLAEQGGDIAAVQAFDVTSKEEVTRGITEIEAKLGPIDILVNNAGIQRRAALTEFALNDWNDVIATNLTSAFLVAQAAARGMIVRGSGKIINIASIQSQLARPGITPYSASKGGIVMLTRGMCADLTPHGIQVNAIAPGYFSTELTSALVADTEFNTWISARTPAGRWGEVSELVGAARFLASDAASFITGQILYVDGGMSAVI